MISIAHHICDFHTYFRKIQGKAEKNIPIQNNSAFILFRFYHISLQFGNTMRFAAFPLFIKYAFIFLLDVLRYPPRM